jgi:hypothetical protein
MPTQMSRHAKSANIPLNQIYIFVILRIAKNSYVYMSYLLRRFEMDKLMGRVKDILFSPKATWEVIKNEETTPMTIVKDYLIYLAALSSVASFIGQALIGHTTLIGLVRIPFFSGLVWAVLGFVLSLLSIYVAATIVNGLAPTYSALKNDVAAFKVVAYSTTAWLAGGVLNLIPRLSGLAFLIGLYSFYLFYLGLPILMQCPKEKALAYTIVSWLLTFVIMLVASVIAGTVIGIRVPLF